MRSNNIGQNIRVLRENEGYSPAKLAAYLHIGWGTISRIETGLEMPSPVMIEKLAALFGVEETELISGHFERIATPKNSFGIFSKEMEEIADKNRQIRKAKQAKEEPSSNVIIG